MVKIQYEFNTYLHQTFRKNVYEARNIKDSYERSGYVAKEIIQLQDRYSECYNGSGKTFIEWLERNCFRIPYANGKVRKVSIYDYALKYMTTGKHERSIFNKPFYNDRGTNDIPIPDNLADDRELNQEDYKELYKALRKLKPLKYQVIIGHYFEDKTLRTIAGEVGKSEQYIGKVHKATLKELSQLEGLSELYRYL